MTRGANVTPELVEKVKKYKAKYPSMTNVDLGEICGTSETTVRKIISGGYEHLETSAQASNAELIRVLSSIAASLEKITSKQLTLEVNDVD